MWCGCIPQRRRASSSSSASTSQRRSRPRGARRSSSENAEFDRLLQEEQDREVNRIYALADSDEDEQRAKDAASQDDAQDPLTSRALRAKEIERQRTEEAFLVAERKRLHLDSPAHARVAPGNPFIVGRDLEPPPLPTATAAADPGPDKAPAPAAALSASTTTPTPGSWKMDPELAAALAEVDSVDEFDIDQFLGARARTDAGAAAGVDVLNLRIEDGADDDLSDLMRSPAKQ